MRWTHRDRQRHRRRLNGVNAEEKSCMWITFFVPMKILVSATLTLENVAWCLQTVNHAHFFRTRPAHYFAFALLISKDYVLRLSFKIIRINMDQRLSRHFSNEPTMEWAKLMLYLNNGQSGGIDDRVSAQKKLRKKMGFTFNMHRLIERASVHFTLITC